MASLSSGSSLLTTSFILMLLLPNVMSFFFSFPSFTPNTEDIYFQGDAFASNDVLQLTRNQKDDNLTASVGRATYRYPVYLWTDFATRFSFIVKTVNSSPAGDGLTFFMAPFNSEIPSNSSGGFLGLFSPDTAFNASANRIIAVEFDNFRNPWDPSTYHAGIDVNSIKSVADVELSSSIATGVLANAWVTYNTTTMNLSVYLSYGEIPIKPEHPILSYAVNLRTVLPNWARIGFSAATGQLIETHSIRSWYFSSSLE